MDRKKQPVYIAIDLKSFYASVECVERRLNPLQTNLVVADPERTEKTICLAVSPSLKAYGISGRARLFEVVQRTKEVNMERLQASSRKKFTGISCDAQELKRNPELELGYIIAPPRMALYIEYSTRIYDIYLRYISEEDIHVYSIDEVFMDVTHYLELYQMSPRELAGKIIADILESTGITATAGIGTNLYLCKIAMDIVAKRMPADENGVRIAQLNELSYRKLLWDHRPLTDFWRVGRGYAEKLEEHGLYTMGDIARCSLGKKSDYYNEDLLYKLFGVNAQLLIDHAWGWEPCTMQEIKAYRPQSNSIGSGQVLQRPYQYEEAKVIIREMTDLLVLRLVDIQRVTDQIVVTVGYDIENLKNEKKNYQGKIKKDHYGRFVPQHAHGTVNLGEYTSSTEVIIKAVVELYQKIVDPKLSIRRIYVTANHLISEARAKEDDRFEQLSLFTDYDAMEQQKKEKEWKRSRERELQLAVLGIKKRFGKNSILKGMNLLEGAMTIERNNQIGGHKA
ncbi:MAG: DNA methylase [Muricoprocola sp.]